MSTGAIVGAASRRAERRLVEHLREAGAVNPSSARPLPAQNWMGSRVLRRLVKAGAIIETKSGYYLDETAYTAYRSQRTRTMGLIIAPLVIAAILVIWWASTR